MANPVMRCGDCRFHACEKLFEKPCIELGKLEVAKQCAQYQPNVKALGEFLSASPTVLQAIGQLVALIPPNKLHVLASVLYNEKATRKQGLHFMQIVYVSWRSPTDGARSQSFRKMYVMEATKEQLRLLSLDGKLFYVQYPYKDGSRAVSQFHGVYSIPQFRTYREAQRKQQIEVAVVETSHYELHSSHKVVIELEEDYEKRADKKVERQPEAPKYDIYDLSVMSRDVERGYIVKSRAYKKKKGGAEEAYHVG